jgi:succinylglutamate desuccinylase
MADSRLDYANEYPVEIVGPDITPLKKGNVGIDYIHTLDSKKPGPHVLVTAVVHGNEPCGVLAVDWFLKQSHRPIQGKLTIAFMNVEAYLAFDPKNPNRTRWVDEDFNRLWGPGVLQDSSRKKTYEFRRANEVLPIVADADLLLDIHSMQKPCVPLMMAGMIDKGRELAKAVGMNMSTITDSGHKEGMRMRDFNGFSDPKSKKNALLVECGQHWEKSSEEVATETLIRFLNYSSIMPAGFGQEYLSQSKNKQTMRFFKVGMAVTIKTDKFVFSKNWQGFDHLAKGTLIGTDGDEPVIAPYEPTVLIMPTKRLFPGLTAVRLAYPL